VSTIKVKSGDLSFTLAKLGRLSIGKSLHENVAVEGMNGMGVGNGNTPTLLEGDSVSNKFKKDLGLYIKPSY
jgi:hypothetical protein